MTGSFHKFPVEGRPKLRRRRRAGRNRAPGASSSPTTGMGGNEGAGVGGSVASGSQDTVTNVLSPRAGNPSSPPSVVGPVRRETQIRHRRVRGSDPLGHYEWMHNDQLSPPVVAMFPVSPQSSASRSSVSSISPSPGPSAPPPLGSRRGAVSVSPINSSHSLSGMMPDYPASAPLAQSPTWPLLPRQAHAVQNQIGYGSFCPPVDHTAASLASAGTAGSSQNVNSTYYEQFGANFLQQDDSYGPGQRSNMTSYNPFNHSASHSLPLLPNAPYDSNQLAEQSFSPVASVWQQANVPDSTSYAPDSALGYWATPHDSLNAHQPVPLDLAMQAFPAPAYPDSALQFNPQSLEAVSDSDLHSIHSMPPTPEVSISDPNPHYAFGETSSWGSCDRRGSAQSQQGYPCARSAFGQFPPNE